jgi:hypothetical protein
MQAIVGAKCVGRRAPGLPTLRADASESGRNVMRRWRGRATALAAVAIVAVTVAAGVGATARHAARTAAARPAPAASARAAASAAIAASTPPSTARAAAPDLGQWCRQLAAHVPSFPSSQCQSAGLSAGDGRSVRGVPLWVRDLPVAGGAPRFKVLLLGGIHGDEFASVALVFDWIARSRGPAAAHQVAWRVVPLVNPDGLMNAPATRVNARGVDLNRNFPTLDWAREAQPYWVSHTKKDPRRFPGPSAMSEPETQWIQRQIEQFRPDLIVSVHAPYGLLDFDGPPPAPPRLGDLRLDPVGVYPGSLGNYGGLVKQVPVMTLELRSAARVGEAERAAMWVDLQRWIGTRLEGVARAPTRAPSRPTRAGA